MKIYIIKYRARKLCQG